MSMLEATAARANVSAAQLLDVEKVRQAYHRGDNPDLLVLDDVSLGMREDEIVGLLGRSGSGKSTLLRIIAGLMRPTAGNVNWCGKRVSGPCEGLAMVFQSFALFPWLTVLENVEIGLEALGIPAAEGRRRAIEAIDLIGLDGFESAYPKEISGGMRQRVGFARALVVHPRLLLMDEPFSALDVLTAEKFTHRLDRSLDRGPFADQVDPHGDTQHRGSRPDVRSRPDLLVKSRARDAGNSHRSSASAQSARSRLPETRRPDLRAHDQTHSGRKGKARERGASRHRARDGVAARLDKQARRPHGDPCRCSLQRQSRSSRNRRYPADGSRRPFPGGRDAAAPPVRRYCRR